MIQLVLTFERQEIVTFLVLLIFVVYFYRKTMESRLNIVLGVLGILITSIYFMESILNYVDTTIISMDINAFNYSQEPRIVVTWYGLLLAMQQFPFGVGFGNFGGIGALKYDSILYYDLHFDRFWWFGEEDFLTDTYYPHIYAEAGFIVLLCPCLGLYFVFLH